MHLTRFVLAPLLLALPVLSGCSPPTATPASASTAMQDAPAPQTAATAAPRPAVKACDMVTPQEMSAILGSSVGAEANDRSSSKTECIYKPAAGISPYVELSVEWGDGESAMTAMGMMGKREPGITNPYEGIGDQAAAVGPTLMIRSGDDLVTLVFSGVDDVPAAAKKIFDTAKARM